MVDLITRLYLTVIPNLTLTVPLFRFSLQTPPGSKVRLKGASVPVAGGFIRLENTNIDLLGGKVRKEY